jgi:phosphoribosylanthranilate isomerase
MENRRIVKVSGIRDLTNARFFASWQVDWLGLNLEDGINLEVANEIVKWLASVDMVGEFGQKSMDEIVEIAKNVGLKGVEIPFDRDATILKDNGIIVFKRLEIMNDAVPFAIPEDDKTDYYILKIKELNTTDQALEQIVEDLSFQKPVLINLNVLDELNTWIGKEGVAGANLTVEPEIRPGVQDFSKWIPVLENLNDQN